jgi:hypothetical protein
VALEGGSVVSLSDSLLFCSSLELSNRRTDVDSGSAPDSFYLICATDSKFLAIAS